MKVEVMSWNRACAKAKYLGRKNFMYTVDDAGEIASIYEIARHCHIWDHVFEVSSSDIDGGTIKIDGYYIPLMFINSITESQPQKMYEVTPAQQELVDELEGTIRSLEVKLRCLKAFAEGRNQPDIAVMIRDILTEEDMDVFEGKGVYAY